jgi:transcriptional regulator with XRE-family HTH domain
VEATTVGRIARWARKRAGMTQQDLARAVGMPQPSIARIERGLVAPRITTLLAILEATGHRLAVEAADQPVDREAIRHRLGLAVPRRTRLALGRAAKEHRTSPVYILRRLRWFGVPFVLIGELAEVAHGAPTKVGRVVEVCHAGTKDARERLEAALGDLAATTTKGSSFRTDAGRLRLVTHTAAGDDHDLLMRNAVRMPIDSGVLVPVAALDDLIRIRRAGSAPKDRAAEAMMRAIGEESALASIRGVVDQRSPRQQSG